jgi:hypothetical protein
MARRKAMVPNFPARETNMIRVAFAIAVAAMAYMAGSGMTQALPIAPLPAEATTDAVNVIPVYYYRGRYYPYRWHGRYYPYRWGGGYYRHRYYRYGRYRYY